VINAEIISAADSRLFFSRVGRARDDRRNGNVALALIIRDRRSQLWGDVSASRFIAASSNIYADFVFKPGYRLASASGSGVLHQRDGHLPEIPSESR